MKCYETPGGRVFTIGDLFDEYEDLKLLAPDAVPDTFEKYIDECVEREMIREQQAKRFEYSTLFASVGRKIETYLKAFQYKYKLDFESNLIWKFEIMATERQKEELEWYIKEVLV